MIVGALVTGAVLLLTQDGDARTATPAAKVNRFDGNRAWAELVREVDVGPRPAGSPALRSLAQRLRKTLPNGHFEQVGGGLQNIVGTLPGRLPAIVLAAHYDTKDTPAGFVGANDGAGGTALVLEAARALRRLPQRNPRQVRFVLFDGEESPHGCSDFLTCGIRGSRAYAAPHAKQLKALVLADFVAEPQPAAQARPRQRPCALGPPARRRRSAPASARSCPPPPRGPSRTTTRRS